VSITIESEAGFSLSFPLPRGNETASPSAVSSQKKKKRLFRYGAGVHAPFLRAR
jgi:hypothetical protein